ncbi:MAG: hypothetical protein H7Y38_09300 [Armatimonadetes bacterium]|nr:hypothetical protein [Armatimonadota bacterium]
MPTLTLDLPDTAYRAALTLTPRERNRFAAVMFATLETIDAETDSDRAAAFAAAEEADIQAVGRGLADEAAGRTVPGDVVFAQMREQARHGLK